MKRDNVKKFSVSGLKTSGIPLSGSGKKEGAGGVEQQPETSEGGEGAERRVT